MWQVQVQRRTWIYFNGESQQVGGFVKEFSNLAFLTVKVRPGLLQLTKNIIPKKKNSSANPIK